jgi:hypothetical protein
VRDEAGMAAAVRAWRRAYYGEDDAGPAATPKPTQNIHDPIQDEGKPDGKPSAQESREGRGGPSCVAAPEATPQTAALAPPGGDSGGGTAATDARAKAGDDADAGPMEAPGDTEDRPVQTANAESASRPSGGGGSPATDPDAQQSEPVEPPPRAPVAQSSTAKSCARRRQGRRILAATGRCTADASPPPHLNGGPAPHPALSPSRRAAPHPDPLPAGGEREKTGNGWQEGKKSAGQIFHRGREFAKAAARAPKADEAALIAEAIAAGKVRKVPPGSGLLPDWVSGETERCVHPGAGVKPRRGPP